MCYDFRIIFWSTYARIRHDKGTARPALPFLGRARPAERTYGHMPQGPRGHGRQCDVLQALRRGPLPRHPQPGPLQRACRLPPHGRSRHRARQAAPRARPYRGAGARARRMAAPLEVLPQKGHAKRIARARFQRRAAAIRDAAGVLSPPGLVASGERLAARRFPHRKPQQNRRQHRGRPQG